MDSGSQVIFSSAVEMDRDDIQSKPLRVTGILSVLFGLLSAVALVGPYMWFLPVLAILLALIGLRPSKVPYAGKTWAVAGLCLGLFFGSWAVASHTAAKQLHLKTAEGFAIAWLDCFKSGQPEFCFEMTLPEAKRRYSSVDLEKFYAETNVPADDSTLPPDGPMYANFIENPLVQSLLEAGRKPQWEFVELTKYDKTFNSRRFTMNFRDTSGTITELVEVTMEANSDNNHQTRWEVRHYATVD